jgi:Ferritin-like domain
VTGEPPIDARVGTRSRRAILRNAFVAALAVGGALEADALVGPGGTAGASTAPRSQDAKILNFLLELEQLQSTLFDRSGRDSRLSAELRQFATVTAKQDRAHIAALRSLLGPAAQAPTARLKADPQNDAEFIRDALALKEATVAAYIGEAPNLSLDKIEKVASIVSVDARHAAWIRSIHDVIPAPRAADRSATPAGVVRTLEGSGVATVR